MAVQQVPPQRQPPPKKSGMGCFGCGCLVVVLFFLLLGGVIGGFIYYTYHELYIVSSAQAGVIPPFKGGPEIYEGAQKKIAAFNQDVSTGKTSTLTLSADEINSLIANDPEFKKNQVQLHVDLQGDQMRLQGTSPSNAIPLVKWGVKDRYFNFDVTTGISFNTDTKAVEFDLHKAQIGDVTYPEDALPSLQTLLARLANQQMRLNTPVWNVLQAAKTITVKDGQFVIETN